MHKGAAGCTLLRSARPAGCWVPSPRLPFAAAGTLAGPASGRGYEPFSGRGLPRELAGTVLGYGESPKPGCRAAHPQGACSVGPGPSLPVQGAAPMVAPGGAYIALGMSISPSPCHQLAGHPTIPRDSCCPSRSWARQPGQEAAPCSFNAKQHASCPTRSLQLTRPSLGSGTSQANARHRVDEPDD